LSDYLRILRASLFPVSWEAMELNLRKRGKKKYFITIA